MKWSCICFFPTIRKLTLINAVFKDEKSFGNRRITDFNHTYRDFIIAITFACIEWSYYITTLRHYFDDAILVNINVWYQRIIHYCSLKVCVLLTKKIINDISLSWANDGGITEISLS